MRTTDEAVAASREIPFEQVIEAVGKYNESMISAGARRRSSAARSGGRLRRTDLARETNRLARVLATRGELLLRLGREQGARTAFAAAAALATTRRERERLEARAAG